METECLGKSITVGWARNDGTLDKYYSTGHGANDWIQHTFEGKVNEFHLEAGIWMEEEGQGIKIDWILV